MTETVGGQAVIEGVMMRHKNRVAIAIRKGREIKIKKEKFKSLADKYPFLKWVFFRGIITMFEMLVMGIKALTYSSNETLDKDEKITSFEITMTFVLAIGLTVVLFLVLPVFLTRLITMSNGILFNIIDGIIRVAIFLIYLFAISLMKDIRRIFEYHGAEHKAVHCYEEKEKLTVENAKKFKTAHPRCGTSFLLIVMVVSILVFSVIVSPKLYVKVAARIVLLPVIIGMSYEILKMASRFEKNVFFKMLIAPNLWLQKLTTREPDKKQLEVAIAALKKVI